MVILHWAGLTRRPSLPAKRQPKQKSFQLPDDAVLLCRYLPIECFHESRRMDSIMVSLLPQRGMPERIIKAAKRVALVAHDKRKDELLQWAKGNRESLARHELVATGTTGKLIEDALGLPVKRLITGPLGGDQQLGAMIAEGAMDLVVFFWDPLEAQPHDSDVKALIRLAVAWNIIIACNVTTADFVLASPLMDRDYRAGIPEVS
jgi:methylglyoxal synthase